VDFVVSCTPGEYGAFLHVFVQISRVIDYGVIVSRRNNRFTQITFLIQ